MLDQTLPNGLRVLVVPQTAAPLVAVYVWLDTGTADEPDNAHGAAHFLEHMLFKSTTTRGVGQSAAEIEGLGGDLNAYTTYDQTVLHATVEESGFDATLTVLADMVRNPAFEPEEFAREKQVVLEEIRSYDDEPESVIEDLAASLSTPDHPYGRPILGTLPTVTSITPEILRSFWQENYGADRAVVAICGAVDPEAALAAVKRELGDWRKAVPRKALPVAVPPAEQALRRVPKDFETRVVDISWRTPPFGHADIPALDVLASLLGAGSASLFQVRLQLDEGLVTDTWAGLSVRRSTGSLSTGALPREGKTAEVVRAMLDVVDDIRCGRISRGVVTRARDAILADGLFAGETVDGAAHDLVWYTARTGLTDGAERHRTAVAKVTVDDVVQVAKRWLDAQAATVVALDRTLTDEALHGAVNRRPSKARRAVAPGEVIKHVLDNGATVLVLPDDSQVAALRLVCAGGRAVENPRTAGIHGAWSRLVMMGAGDYDAAGFGEAVDALAGTLDATAGRNGIGLRGTFPADAILDGLALTGDLVLDPHLDDEEWERTQEEMLEEIATVHDRPGSVANQLLWENLWPGHPWRLPRWGTEATVRRIRPATLRAWHEQHMSPDNVVLAVAGGVDPSAVIDAVTPWLEELVRGHSPTSSPVAQPPRSGLRKRQAGREQTQVLTGWRGLSTADADRTALSVLTAWLNAQGGPLFMALREERGLAYGVWAQTFEGFEGGTFTVGLSTEPDRGPEARAGLNEVLSNLRRAPPTTDMVKRAVRMSLGHAAMGLQRTSDRASNAALGERFGVPWGFEAHKRLLNEITATDVARVIERILSQPATEVTVEPLS